MNMPDELVSVRYMVHDVEEAIDFYTTQFDFTVRSSAAPAFADVVRGNLRLLLSGPTSSAGRPMPDGRTPGPGGWNRIHFVVEDIAADVERLRAAGLTFRNDIVTGPGRPADPARGPLRQSDRTLPAGGRVNEHVRPRSRQPRPRTLDGVRISNV
jgi:catechol 2,3-dioxygenase-like lactoylglutathione lyase family enzyme